MQTAEETTANVTIDNTPPELDEPAHIPSPAARAAEFDEQQGEQNDDEDAIENEVVVTIEGAPPAPSDPDEPTHDQLRAAEPWVRATRKKNRELARKLRQLEARLATAQPAAPPTPEVVTVGPEPKLEDLDWDAEKYRVALLEWADRKRKVEEQRAQARQSEEQAKNAWQQKLQAFGKAEAELRVRGYPDAKQRVIDSLDVTQQGIIVHSAKNPALVTYAIGSNPQLLKDLATKRDPIEFAVELGRIEAKMQTQPTAKKLPPTPETTPRGVSPRRTSDEAELDRLRQGVIDGTVPAAKLIEYRRAMTAAAKNAKR